MPNVSIVEYFNTPSHYLHFSFLCEESDLKFVQHRFSTSLCMLSRYYDKITVSISVTIKPMNHRCMCILCSNYLLLQPRKVLSFEDSKQRAAQWKKAIESLQNL